MMRLPLVHVAASIGILLVVLRLALSTRRVLAGAAPGSVPVLVLMTGLGALVFWQASIWLTNAHPEATAAFRAGVVVQWLGGAVLALLSALNLVIARQRSTPRADRT